MSTIENQNNETNDALIQAWERVQTLKAEAMAQLFPHVEPPIDLTTFLPSPLKIPECSSGKVTISHRQVVGGTPIISRRQAYTRGVRPVTLTLDRPLIAHELHEKGHGLWMTDLPEELYQIYTMLQAVKPQGNVLVGGLGLGLIPHYLGLAEQVTTVTVVERSRDIVKLVKPYLPAGVKVVHRDIARFLLTSNQPFDTYLLDTWQGTSEDTWWSEVLPLKRIIRNRWGIEPKVHCWAEDIMAGQVAASLLMNKNNWYYADLPHFETPAEAAWFVSHIGTVPWERMYGDVVTDNLMNHA